MIEILVTLAIIGLIMVLTIPAVLATRGAMRKIDCQNNLKQLGLALHGYIATHQFFPPGATGLGFSLHSQLLPNLEQNILYNSLNFSTAVYSYLPVQNQNYTVACIKLHGFMCPSETYPASQTASFAQARTNYMGDAGFGSVSFGPNGLFFDQPTNPIGFSAITDGSTQTAAMVESCLGAAATNISDPRAAVFDTPSLSDSSQLYAFIAACQYAGLNQITYAEAKLNFWISSNLGCSLMNHMLTPNQHSCTNGHNINDGAFTASSYHNGGVNVLFADGHLQFINSTISLAVWRGISTFSSGEVVDSSSF